MKYITRYLRANLRKKIEVLIIMTIYAIITHGNKIQVPKHKK
ncbi:hypothetical protein SYNTR_0566 [Candidatus Syntrophocurvum alkaliphilum]|uniref:Uncharacterized protein n=1 Tax=Candidatus Syntrophocurvum alkaliphilum TaxID=2293317 RepID=A0A6I6DHU2_9FIRM|nr:hypothetical protein SYNTR_0566 [Candidatus Syntrophocurvum alkaliphilum]